jgi:nucleotide-binding universal stress UspA family protein
MRLLVGFDGSEGGRDALELARVLASLDDGTIEQRTFDNGSAAKTIVELAEEEDFDAIVLGSPHRGAIGRALIGSVAEGVLHGAPRATVVAPRGYAENGHGPFATIAVAFDGTPESKVALNRARELAEASRAALRIFTVVAPPVALPSAVGYTPVNPPEPEKVIEEGVTAVGDAVPVDAQRLDGAPAHALSKACEDGVDLLVAGSRGYGPVARVLLGSVSTQLINLAPCPVLVVPRPGRCKPAHLGVFGRSDRVTHEQCAPLTDLPPSPDLLGFRALGKGEN